MGCCRYGDFQTGKHPDDGASISVVSVAWVDDEPMVGASRSATADRVRAFAWPFHQGVREGKPEWRGQEVLDLWDTGDPNLPESEWRALIEWLSRRGRTLVFHNCSFDTRMLRDGVRFGPAEWNGSKGAHWAGRDFMPQVIWDSQIAERELAPAGALIGLDAATKRAAITWQGATKASEAGPVKTWLRQQKLPAGRYDLVPWDVISSYAAGDAATTIRLALWQLLQVADLDICGGQNGADLLGCRLGILLQRQVALYNIESRGLPFDSAACLAEAAKLQGQRQKLADQLPFRPTDPAAKAYWFGPASEGGQGLTPYGVTAKGSTSLDKEIVNRMVGDGVKYAAEWQRLSQIDTALSMWYLGYPASQGPDGRLRQVFRPTKVVSGRMSVERVNLQAIPHDYRLSGLPEGIAPVRSFIRLPKQSGDILVELDLAQAELRAAAISAQCDPMIEMIHQGKDLHGVTAAELFSTDSSDPKWFEYRQVAKRSNFSLIFDVGAKTFQLTLAKQLNIYWTEAACADVIRRWHRLYEYRFKQAVHRAMKLVEQRRWLRLMNGRVRRFSDLEVRFDSHKAFNQFIQGSLAEMVMDWTVWAEATYPGVVINMVHDSLVMQVPRGPHGKEICEAVAAKGAALFTEMWGIEGGVDWGVYNQK